MASRVQEYIQQVAERVRVLEAEHKDITTVTTAHEALVRRLQMTLENSAAAQSFEIEARNGPVTEYLDEYVTKSSVKIQGFNDQIKSALVLAVILRPAGDPGGFRTH
jgi:hypothetical protein